MPQCAGLWVTSHERALEGASPNHSATSAFTRGSMMWFIHRYMQLGCCACELIIQVSDQPVAPSDGSTVLTGCFSSSRTLAWYCQVVPSTEAPLEKSSISSVALAQ